jgi:ABC-type transport system involved in multi-copper enzyme maturation permease subunit
MRQFFAILRDSFREAVDGFVIYAMLVLSALVIILLGSLSFAPAEPKEAFANIVGHFNDVVVEGGHLRGAMRQAARFESEDVRPEGSGYRLRVRVTGEPRNLEAEAKKDAPPGKEPEKEKVRSDGFREIVAVWAKTKPERNEIPIFQRVTVTAEELKGVGDEQMEKYVKKQFEFYAGMDVSVKRVSGVAEPAYDFDVTTAGGSAVRGWPHKVGLFFGAWTLPVPFNLGETLFWIQDRLVNGIGAALALLISIVLTAFYIPNLLRKGSIDLLISKPLGRSQLLVYKYVGGLTFIFILTAFTVGGVWLALAARSGVWDPSFLIVIPVLTFTFAILYSVSTLAAVLTRSAIVSILVSVAFAVFLYIVGNVKTVFDALKANDRAKQELPEWSFTLVDALNDILPRYKDLDKLTTKLLSAGTLTQAEMRERTIDVLDYPSWGSTIGVSLAFIAVMLLLSCLRMNRRDY